MKILMLMLWSIVLAFNLKDSRWKTTLQVFFIATAASPSGIYGTLLLPLVLLMTTVEQKILFAGFTFICVKLRALLSNGPPSHIRNVRSCKFVLRTCTKNSLSMKLTSQKLIQWPYFFSAKNYSTAKRGCRCKIPFFLNLWKIPVSSCVCNRKIF